MINSNDIKIVITKESVKAKDYEKYFNIFRELLATKESIIKNRGKMVISVTGYEDDGLAPFEIPEVVKFIKELDKKFKFWFYFCKPNDEGLRVLTSCLCKPNRLQFGIVYYYPGSVEKFLKERLIYVTIVEYKCKLSKSLATRIRNRVEEYYFGG